MVARARELGKVSSVFFGKEDHGILTLSIVLDFGGTAQGCGGYALDDWSERKQRRMGTAAGADFVLRILDLFGVDSLEQIKGKPVWALREGENFPGVIAGLEIPKFDGERRFVFSDWQREWADGGEATQ